MCDCFLKISLPPFQALFSSVEAISCRAWGKGELLRWGWGRTPRTDHTGAKRLFTPGAQRRSAALSRQPGSLATVSSFWYPMGTWNWQNAKSARQFTSPSILQSPPSEVREQLTTESSEKSHWPLEWAQNSTFDWKIMAIYLKLMGENTGNGN